VVAAEKNSAKGNNMVGSETKRSLAVGNCIPIMDFLRCSAARPNLHLPSAFRSGPNTVSENYFATFFISDQIEKIDLNSWQQFKTVTRC
jgi:hypothetical protein